MSQIVQHQLEERFVQLKSSLSDEKWSDHEFLKKKVLELESGDIALAFRLMQRVRNLSPSEDNKIKLETLKKQALKAFPALAETSSKEKNQVITKVKNIGGTLTSQISKYNKINFRNPFFYCVVFPFLIFTFYQIILSSPRFESQAKLIIKEPNGIATLDPAMAVISGFGVTSTSLDTELVKAFVFSNDMLEHLEFTLSFDEHYTSNKYDIFSRLENDPSRESKLEYFHSKINVELDDVSQVISIFVQAFEPEFANKMSKAIVSRSEWYINEIGHNLAKAQLKFVQQEHGLVEQKLQVAKSNLLDFQRRHDLLDPLAEGVALQQIAYRLEAEIASKQTELRALKSSMSNNAPRVIQSNAELKSLEEQLYRERNRLTRQSSTDPLIPEEERNLSVSQILSKFSDYKINMELALSAYTSSQISLEKSRIEAYRQLKYLVIVESPTIPEEAKYPSVIYNITLFLTIALMLFGIGKIVIAIVTELR